MATTVDLVSVVINWRADFDTGGGGERSASFSFVPGVEDGPLVAALLAKHDALLIAAAKAEGPAGPLGTG